MKFYRSKALTIPMTEPDVNALVEQCTEYYVGALIGRRPGFSSALAGKSFTLRFDGNGPQIPYTFSDEHTLVWIDESGVEHQEYYEALQIDKNVYLLAHIRKSSRPNEALTFALDFDLQLVTGVLSKMGNAVSARTVSQSVRFGVIDEGTRTPIAWRHHFTRDLVGKSMGWSYRDDMVSQHFYVTPHSYAWAILTGPGAGLMSSAPGEYVKISDHVYLLTWVESRGSGQQGVVLMNLRTMHDVGTFYGVNHSQKFEYYTFGARAYNLGSYDTRDRWVL